MPVQIEWHFDSRWHQQVGELFDRHSSAENLVEGFSCQALHRSAMLKPDAALPSRREQAANQQLIDLSPAPRRACAVQRRDGI